MRAILEEIFKGLVQWLYGLTLEIVEYVANMLLDVFAMDLSYFESSVPVTRDIMKIVVAIGWALLIGNLVFQAAKSMMSGLGFEGEDPKALFARTLVFGFCLIASRQICEIGLGMSNAAITLLKVPSSISIHVPLEDSFDIGASWLLALVAGAVLMWQIIKMFVAVGERYFLTGVLTLLAPLAFATGGSRNTADIFKGWARMYASMCLMMVLNVIFLKLLLSAMGIMPTDLGVVPWLIFLVAITRTAKKIDGVILRIGLSPANAGGQGRGLPGMLSYVVLRAATKNIMQSAGGRFGGGGSAGKPNAPPRGAPKPSGPSAGKSGFSGRPSPGTSNSHVASNAHGASNTRGTSQSASGAHTASGGQTASGSAKPQQQPATGTAGNAQRASDASGGKGGANLNQGPQSRRQPGGTGTAKGGNQRGTSSANNNGGASRNSLPQRQGASGTTSAGATPNATTMIPDMAGRQPPAQTAKPPNAAQPTAQTTKPPNAAQPSSQTTKPPSTVQPSSQTTKPNAAQQSAQTPTTQPSSLSTAATASSQPSSSTTQSSRRSSVNTTGGARSPVFSAGAAGNPTQPDRAAETAHPPVPRSGITNRDTAPASVHAATPVTASQGVPPQPQTQQSRHTPMPPSLQNASGATRPPGTAGRPPIHHAPQGGADATNHANTGANQSISRNDSHSLSNRENALQQNQNIQTTPSTAAQPGASGAAATRNTSAPRNAPVPPATPKGAAGTAATKAATTPPTGNAPNRSTSGNDNQRGGAATHANDSISNSTANHYPQPRGSSDATTASRTPQTVGANPATGRQEPPQTRRTDVPASARQQPPQGAAGKSAHPPTAPYPAKKPDMTGTRQSAAAAGGSDRIGKAGRGSKILKGMRDRKFRKGRGK